MRHDYGYFEEDHPGNIGDAGLWKRILTFVAPYRYWVAVAVVLSLLISAAGLSLPYLVRRAMDDYIVKEGVEAAARMEGLAHLSLVFLAIMATGFVANFFQVILLEWAGQNMMHAIRQTLFRHTLRLEVSFFNRNPVGRLVTRLTNDIQNMHEMFTSVIVTVFNDFVRLFGILAILFYMNWRLALWLSLLSPLMIYSTYWFGKLARKAFRDIRTRLARINAFLQEGISGLSILQLFGREKDARDGFSELTRSYYQATLYQIKVFGTFMPFIEVLHSLGIALVVWYGGGEIVRERLTLGELTAFLSYLRLFFQPLRELSQKYSVVQSAMASAERIFQLLDTREILHVAPDAVRPASIEGRIDFREVSFGYDPAHPVIHRLSFKVEPGETLAIVGATGSGKTTLINLLERFYDPDAGAVEVDGIDVKRWDPLELRRKIGLVMQEVLVVPGTLEENIALDVELGPGELERILELSQLSSVAERLPQGTATPIGEGGMDLSAGQKQLLAFARVLARDPRILVLDEATANVDTETEMRIEQAIEAALANRTSIVIAHRLSTIRRAHRILVMDRGRILEEGDHEALMARQGLYYHLQSLQSAGC